MELAEIQTATRRRDVALAASGGFDAEEIAEIMELEIREVLEDLAWLAERKKERLAEERELSTEIADEVMQLQDDEAMMRRWILQTSNVGLRVKLMDRLHKLRELRLKLLGAFDKTAGKPKSITLVEIGFDGTVKKAEKGEIIDVESAEPRAIEPGEPGNPGTDISESE